MKTLKLTLTAIALLLVGTIANKASAKDKITKGDVVNIYIDAIATGKTQDVDKVLDDELQFNMKRGSNVNTVNKNDFLSSLTNAGASNPQHTETTVLQGDDNSEKVKIEFKYDGFSRTDVVTLNRSFAWKITSVDSSYK
jgi:hypothetical protein